MNRILIYSVCFILLAIIVYMIFSSKNCEGFNKCICTEIGSGRGRNCQSIEKVEYDYNHGITENNPKWAPNRWSTVSPGDIDFPLSNGCSWSGPRAKEHTWQKWDFTDFGSGNGGGIKCSRDSNVEEGVENYTFDRNQAYSGEEQI